MAGTDTPTTGERLAVDLEKRQGGFELRVAFSAGAEILVLFGPSGSGKTTCLNLLAGLLAPDAGEVVLDGRVLFRRRRPGPAANLPARRRNIGYVFQQYALFPHLTALDNVAYALWRQADGRQRARAMLERVGLQHLAHRFPHELSGGQQQRVAIARALAAAPSVLLLDEPFSALDAPTRQRLQNDLAALQAEMGLVVLYVTHRLEDAFAIGHRLAVMRDGRVEQVGPIADVFRYPANHHVAEVMGIRNFFRARVMEASPGRLLLDWEGMPLEAPAQALAPGSTVAAYIRPEDVKLLYPGRPLSETVSYNRTTGRILHNGLGVDTRLVQLLLPNGQEIEVRFPSYSYTPLCLDPGQEVQLSLRREAIIILPA